MYLTFSDPSSKGTMQFSNLFPWGAAWAGTGNGGTLGDPLGDAPGDARPRRPQELSF